LQWSCPISERWESFSFAEFDAIVSASPSIAHYFKEKKISTFYLQQAFDETILNNVSNYSETEKNIIFIGNFSKYHSYRYEVIEYLLQNEIDIDVYGTVDETVSKNSLLRKKIKPPITGVEMFNLYKQYKIALHVWGGGTEQNGIDWSSFAGAKRNFEITGIGTALLTSYQENLNELFSENEILTFKTKEECLQKIKHYLSQPEELKKIAQAGQQKTLQTHTFINRAKELLQIITKVKGR
jgi:spore maturation protein CgeB